MFEDFTRQVRHRVESTGGRVVFVQLTALEKVLEERVGAQSRHEHGKLTDHARLREMLATFDPQPLHRDDVVIDTAGVSPEEAATTISAASS